MDMRASHLHSMIVELEKGTINYIEFGVRGSPFYTFFRIRVIGTPAGRQFAIKMLHNGMEGSGDYFPLHAKEELKAQIWRHIERIEAPITGNFKMSFRMVAELQAIRKKRPPLEFITF